MTYEGELYIPCFFPGLTLWKQWPHEAMRDGRSILRLGGTRYSRRAVRVSDSETYDAVWQLMASQLGAPDPEQVWIFRLDPWPEAEEL